MFPLRVRPQDISTEKNYYICDESSGDVFQFKFDSADEAVEKWDWAIFNDRQSAEWHKGGLIE